MTIDNGELTIREGKKLSIVNSPIVAGDQVTVIVVEVHAAPFAIAEHIAISTHAFPCPSPVAIFLKAIVPNINEAVFVDVSLVEVGTDARTAGYSSIDQNRCRADTRIAVKNLVTDFSLVIAKETFAGKACMYLTFRAAMADELEDPGELSVVDLQLRSLSRPSNRENGEDTPVLDSQLDQEILEQHQVFEVSLVDAGHDIPDDLLLFRQHRNGIDSGFEAPAVSSEPVVCLFEPVEADGDGMHSGCQQRVQPCAVK